MLTIMLVISTILLLSGVPIFVSFSIGGFMWCLLYLGLPFESVAEIFFNSVNKYSLLAVPFFMLSGSLMGETGVTSALLGFTNAIFGRIRGILGASLIWSCALMGAMTGSTVATVTTMMESMVPIMERFGYPKTYSCGILGTSGHLAALIPPSTNAVLFGYITEMSIGKLFMAGLLPGIAGAIILSMTAVVIARKRKFGSLPLSMTGYERLRGLSKVLPALLIITVVLGSIYTGVLVPTEAGLVACFITVIIGQIFYRRLSFSQLLSAIGRSLAGAANVYLLIASSSLLGYLLVYLQIPQAFTNAMLSLGMGYWSFIFVSIFIFLVLGTALDPAVCVIVAVPIMMPTVKAIGMDPYVFYILENCIVGVAQLTPPDAVVLYTMSSMAKLDIWTILKESWPYVLTGSILLVIVVVLFPELANFIPNRMH
jgi:C4-dicarboxylate transporter DctM subunit